MADDAPNVGAEEAVWDIEIAAAKVKEGKNLIDDDPDKAMELLCKALRAYEKHYGGSAIESAPVYLYYGIAVFEVARNATEVLGSTKATVKPGNAQAVPKAAETAPCPAKQDADGADAAPSEANDASMKDATAETKEPEAAEAGPAATDVDATEAQAGTDAKANADEIEHDGDEEKADADDGDKGAEEAGKGTAGSEEAGEGAGAGEAAEGADEDDDMKLAWEMLEMARLIYEENTPEMHRDKLADVHKALGDIKLEEEQFDEAVECYKQGLEQLEAVQPRHHRRVAETQYWLSKALTFAEKPDEALTVTNAALASLEAAVAETEEKLAELPTDGSGGEAAEEEGRRLQGLSDDLRGIIAELHENAEGLKEAIANQVTIKEGIKQCFKKAMADLESGGSKPAAGPISLGTVGRGTKRITLQPSGPASNEAPPADKRAPATDAANAAPPIAPATAKRTLEDLMGGGSAAGGETAAGFEAIAVVETREEGQQAKKARTEEPATDAGAVPAEAN